MNKKTYIWKEGDTKNVVELFNKMWPEEHPMTEEELNKQHTGQGLEPRPQSAADKEA